MAIVTTYYFIKQDQYGDTLALADLLAGDIENLIHKSCGWMLREVGKRDESVLVDFLDAPAVTLHRTALRYAIKRFPASVRKQYLRKNAGSPAPTYMPRWRAYRYVMDASAQLKEHVIQTPVTQSKMLGDVSGASVYLKLENEQHSGSFKYRGALNKLMSLSEPPPLLTIASTGNHGLASSMVLKKLGFDGTVYVPSTADPYKVDSLRQHGIRLVFYGQDGVDTEQKAREIAEHNGHEFISPYNDWQIIAGQGTIAIEILDQIGPLDYIFVSVGGGGLISGIALALKNHLPAVKIVGCCPERSNVMQRSVEMGYIVELPSQPTLSDGTAGGIEPNAVTLPLCMDLVDDWVMATEEEIASAIHHIYQEHNIRIEGSAAVTVACFQKYAGDLTGQRIALIICGGNISDQNFNSILSRFQNE